MTNKTVARRLGSAALLLQIVLGCGTSVVIPPPPAAETTDEDATEPTGPEIIVGSGSAGDDDEEKATGGKSGKADGGKGDAGKADAGKSDAGNGTPQCASPLIACAGACVQTTTVEHCGGCDPCAPPPANATAKCVTGACKYYCKVGFHPEGGVCVSDTPPPPPACLAAGSDCTDSADCCNHDCFYNICICRGNGQKCSVDSDCCKGLYCGVNSKTCRGVEAPNP